MPFIAWGKKLSRAKPQELSGLEKNGMELAERYWTYQDVRRGQKLEVLPVEGSKTQQWGSVAQLLQAQWNEKNDSSGQIRKAKEEWQKAQTAYLANNAEAFNTASENFIAALREVGPQLGDYPSAEIVDLEVAYNHWAPLRVAWVCTLLALLGALLGGASGWRPCYRAALGFYGAGVLAMLVGFGMRTAISARAPVTNMYESVVFVGLGAAAFGLVFELIYRKRYMLTAAAAVSTLALMLADACPAILDPSIRPLTPVLRSNFWLVIHVMTIMLSYAAFALALVTGNIALGFYLRRSANRAAIAALSKLTYQLLQAGVLLLILGTFLGASWADYSWGRFWGWDPKEVWALITLLGYLALLHARHVGWLHDFGVAAFSVLCFTLILMAWYGVNFVLGTGLHSYGFGGGGQIYVLAAIGLQFLYVGAAGAMTNNHSSETRNRS
jgi:cytochrome c-type biogenesis protein CcsB